MFDINNNEILIGEGGFAKCYLLKGKNIVEKRLKQEYQNNFAIKKRFKREYEIANSLQNINGIIKVFEFKQTSYTMEYAKDTLKSYIENNNVDIEIKKNLILQLLKVISIIHTRGIIHRDLSPLNLLLVEGYLKIADFGLGKNLININSYITQNTNVTWQYDYCDPRIISGKSNGDIQSDIFSIGRIINFIFTKDPYSTLHIFKSICEKTSCPIEYRYKTVDELIKDFCEIDNEKNKESIIENFDQIIKNKTPFNTKDINNLSKLNNRELFKMNKSDFFRESIIECSEKELISDQDFISLIDKIIEYTNTDWNVIKYHELDDVGYLGSMILLSKCSYPVKEKAIECANICIDANRFDYKKMIKRFILGKIESLLEEKLHLDKLND